MTSKTTAGGPFAWANPDHAPVPFEREPQPRPAASTDVDARTRDDLVSSVRALAAAVGQPGIDRPERLARAEILAESVGHLRAAAPWLSPYTAGRGSRLADEATYHDPRTGPHTRDDAAARIEADRQARAATADLSALLGYGQVHASGTKAPAATGLLAHAVPAGQIGPAHLSTLPVLSADGLPEAYLDNTDAMEYLALAVDERSAPWHVAAFPMNLARQIADWTTAGQAELERLVTLAVDTRLERAILADLTTGAPTAATLDAAEAAALTAWPAGTAAVIHHPVDTPKLRAEYAGTPDAIPIPTLIAPTGATVGTVHVAALDALLIEASTVDYLAVDEPRLLGKAIALYRYGRGVVRATGAVQKVTL